MDPAYESSYAVVVDTVPDGPRRIGERRQVSLPADQLEQLGLGPGDDVWLMLNPDRPGTMLILGKDVLARLVEKGWTSL